MRQATSNITCARYLALIEFSDRDHFTAAFGQLRSDGIHHGAHGELMRMVSDFRVEFTETMGFTADSGRPQMSEEGNLR